jgi:hypothetical protein
MNTKAPVCPKTWAAVRRSRCIESVSPEPENGFVCISLAAGWASSYWSGSKTNPTVSVHAHWDENLSEDMSPKHWESALKDLQAQWDEIFWRGNA